MWFLLANSKCHRFIFTFIGKFTHVVFKRVKHKSVFLIAVKVSPVYLFIFLPFTCILAIKTQRRWRNSGTDRPFEYLVSSV